MARGDQKDMLSRLLSVMPRWFADSSPTLNALFNGLAYCLAYVHQWYCFAKQQTRIKTATGSFLDLIALDFFGLSLQRQPGQSDAQFLSNIQINMFQERGTRKGVSQILTNLTGRAPLIFEPSRPADTGAYGSNSIGYSLSGGYGSLSLPYQAFVTAYRPITSGIPFVGGYGTPAAAYGVASATEYADVKMLQTPVTDAQIYQALDSAKCEGTVIWAQILPNPAQNTVPTLLSVNFLSGSSVLQ
ncbi:hypothetical protein ACO0K2_17690 [Undibacterium sp. MH2W]|uniref:hypothetical protein n=1 Tax=Undibacterium sp. MH2W TaxID=3413044 RepID=UPI003BF406FD